MLRRDIQSIIIGLQLFLAIFVVADLSFDVVPTARGATIYVPNDYPTIQEAVDAANPGDTVFVYNGTYYENVVIDKTINLTGENKQATIIDGGGSRVVYVSADWVNITNFKIRKGGRGIRFDSSNNTLKNNIIGLNSDFGVILYYSSNNAIINNRFVNDGILITGNQLLYFNSHHIPTSNKVSGKPIYYFKDSSGVSIDGIPVGEIILVNCTDFNVSNLQIINTDIGIQVAYSTNINIVNNNISSNDNTGIRIFSSDNISITTNNMTYNYNGM